MKRFWVQDKQMGITVECTSKVEAFKDAIALFENGCNVVVVEVSNGNRKEVATFSQDEDK